MFAGASSFNQDLGSWYITLIDLAVSNEERMVGSIVAQNPVLTRHNPTYNITGAHADLFEVVDATTLQLKSGQNVTLGTVYQINITAAGPGLFGGSNYHRIIQVTAAEPIDPLLNAPDHAFVTTWTTTAPDQTIRFPVNGSDIAIDWGDGNTTSDVSGPQTHTYKQPGTYPVIVTGNIERFHLNHGPDRASLSSIDQWGNSSWISMEGAFYGASKMAYRATDAPDLSRVADMSGMFADTDFFTGNISSWDVSSVTDMSGMFWESRFNGNISSWDVSSVTDMSGMFEGASRFNGNISSWDVSSVTDMHGMFYFAYSFDQNLGSWYVTIDNTYIEKADVPGVVGTIYARNTYLDGQNPTYMIESGGDSHRFAIVDGNLLSMVSTAADQTTYIVTIAATGGSVFEDGNNRQNIQVIVKDSST